MPFFGAIQNSSEISSQRSNSSATEKKKKEQVNFYFVSLEWQIGGTFDVASVYNSGGKNLRSSSSLIAFFVKRPVLALQKRKRPLYSPHRGLKTGIAKISSEIRTVAKISGYNMSWFLVHPLRSRDNRAGLPSVADAGGRFLPFCRAFDKMPSSFRRVSWVRSLRRGSLHGVLIG